MEHGESEKDCQWKEEAEEGRELRRATSYSPRGVYSSNWTCGQHRTADWNERRCSPPWCYSTTMSRHVTDLPIEHDSLKHPTLHQRSASDLSLTSQFSRGRCFDDGQSFARLSRAHRRREIVLGGDGKSFRHPINTREIHSCRSREMVSRDLFGD